MKKLDYQILQSQCINVYWILHLILQISFNLQLFDIPMVIILFSRGYGIVLTLVNVRETWNIFND